MRESVEDDVSDLSSSFSRVLMCHVCHVRCTVAGGGAGGAAVVVVVVVAVAVAVGAGGDGSAARGTD